MTLTLKLYQKGDGTPALMGERSYDTPRVTIGRGNECSLALPDPKKYVSRVHAEIQQDGDGRFLIVTSKVNPVFVNGERQGPGARLKLSDGDRLEIGDYEVELLAPPPPPPPRAAPAPEPEPADPDEMTFLGASLPRDQLQPLHESVHSMMPDILLEADPEPAAVPAAPPPAEPKREEARKEDVFAEATFLGQQAPAGVFDESTFLGKAVQSEALESVEDSVFREATSLRNVPPPEEGLFDEETAPPATKPGAADVTQPVALEEDDTPPEERSVFLEQTMLRGKLADITFPNAGMGDGQGLEAALRVFLEGAGLGKRDFASREEMEQFLRQSGAIVRASIDGVMALLVARAEAKKEFRAEDRTMVASRDNNPLKLMADSQEAVDFLFDNKPRTGGFLTPVQAVGDAFDDMRAHEAALIAGMRAAILGALRRFDPKALEEELGKAAGGGLGLNRKAKLWDLFGAYQQKLARDAEDDFNKVFGPDFLAGYTAQVRELKKKK